MHQQPCQQCPQEKVCGYEYTVRRGDSFYLIANRLGVPLRDLLEANSTINPARLMVGDVLCIPMEEDDTPQAPAQPTAPETAEATPGEDLPDLDTPATPEASPAPETSAACPGGRLYTLQAGETTADVLLHEGINLYTLQAANPDTDLTQLAAGQTLCIPAENRSCPTPATYTLLTDDTLESVALRLNASLSALLHANPCLAPGDFRAGVCIFIPGD